MIPATIRRGGTIFKAETYYTSSGAADRKVDDLRADNHRAESRSYLIGDKEIYVVYIDTGHRR